MVTAGPAPACMGPGGEGRLVPAMGGAVLVHLAVAAALLVVPPAAGDRVPDPGTFEVVFEAPVPPAPRIEDLPVTEAEPVSEPVAAAETVPMPEQTVAEAVPVAEPVPVSEAAEVAEVREPLSPPPRPQRPQAKVPEKSTVMPQASPRPAESGSSAAAATGITVSYVARLQAWLERHKSYPRQARSDRIEGAVLLYFAVGRKGDLLAYRIEKSSGHALLDEATIDLIRRAHPMPPMPDDLDRDRLEVVVPILYALKR